MQFKRIAATALGALMAGATVAAPVLGDLDSLPAPFVEDGVANFAIVVGSGGTAAGLASDIAGAIDVAARFGGESFTAQAASGASVTGGDTEEIALGQGLQTGFGRDTWKQNKLSGLLDTKIDFKSDQFDVDEKIILSDNIAVSITGFGGSSIQALYEEAGAKPGLQLTKSAIEYRYVIDDADWDAEAVTSDDTLDVTVLGKSIEITSIGTAGTSMTAQLGTELVLGVGDSATVEGKTVEVTSVGQTSVAVAVGSSSKFIKEGQTFTVGGIKVTVPSGGILYTDEVESRQVQLRVGAETTKTITDGDSMEEFGEPEDEGDAKWVWNIGNSTHGGVEGSFALGALWNQQYDDEDEAVVFEGSAYNFPNNYGAITFSGLEIDKYNDFEFELDTVDASDAIATATNEKALKVSAKGLTDEGFTVNKVGGGTEETHEVYLIENATAVWLGWKDSENDVQMAATTNFNITFDDTKIQVMPLAQNGSTIDSGSVTSFDRFQLVIPAEAGGSDRNLFLAANTSIDGASQFLGATDGESEAAEVMYPYGTTFGTKEYDVLTHYGVVIKDPDGNGNSDKVVLSVPADQQNAIISVTGPGQSVTTSSSGDLEIRNPIKTSVAKVDTEVSDPASLSEHLILVGGPCVNRVTAQAMGLEYPACGESSGLTEGEGLVKLFDDAFSEGQSALVVAGWDSTNTRAAANAVQNFDSSSMTGTEHML